MKTFECKPWLIWKARKENYCWARICCHSLAETIHVFWEAFALSYLIHCERPSWQHLSTLVQFLFSSLCHKRNKHLAHIHLSQHTTYSPELHNKLSQGYRIQSLWPSPWLWKPVGEPMDRFTALIQSLWRGRTTFVTVSQLKVRLCFLPAMCSGWQDASLFTAHSTNHPNNAQDFRPPPRTSGV